MIDVNQKTNIIIELKRKGDIGGPNSSSIELNPQKDKFPKLVSFPINKDETPMFNRLRGDFESMEFLFSDFQPETDLEIKIGEIYLE